MKQKQVKAAPKTPAKQKATKKAPPTKAVEEEVAVEEHQEEEIVETKVVAKKPANNKKPTRAQKAVEAAPVEEEEPEEEVAEESGDDEGVEGEDVEMDGEEAEAEEEDDEAPTEEGVGEEPTIPSKVKSGEIPATVPKTKIVHVTKLPKKCKQIDVVEVFGKYGAIDQIHLVTNPVGTVANIAYKTEKAAKAALAANKKVQVLDSIIWVTMKKEKNDAKKGKMMNDRTIYIRCIKAGTTEEQIEEHFKECGEIERIKLVNKFNSSFAFVTFTETPALDAALKLHNSILNDVNIGVYQNSENSTKVGQLYDEKLTVMVKNKQSFENIEASKIENIFAKCGEIECMDIVCKKNVLAFVTFKNETEAEAALKLNGKTLEDIELELELYNPFSNKTTIYVSNLPRECTEEDITKLFSRAGEIANVFHKGAYAIVRFENSDGYCKSFLYNESFIKNQMIFVEPHSMRKKTLMVKNKFTKPFHKKGNKRPAENGNSVFTPKKAKNNN